LFARPKAQFIDPDQKLKRRSPDAGTKAGDWSDELGQEHEPPLQLSHHGFVMRHA